MFVVLSNSSLACSHSCCVLQTCANLVTRLALSFHNALRLMSDDMLCVLQMYAMPVFDMCESLCIKKGIRNNLFTRVIVRSAFVILTAFVGISIPFFGGELSFSLACKRSCVFHSCIAFMICKLAQAAARLLNAQPSLFTLECLKSCHEVIKLVCRLLWRYASQSLHFSREKVLYQHFINPPPSPYAPYPIPCHPQASFGSSQVTHVYIRGMHVQLWQAIFAHAYMGCTHG